MFDFEDNSQSLSHNSVPIVMKKQIHSCFAKVRVESYLHFFQSPLVRMHTALDGKEFKSKENTFCDLKIISFTSV